MKGNKESTRPK